MESTNQRDAGRGDALEAATPARGRTTSFLLSIVRFVVVLPFVALGGCFLYVWYLGKALQVVGRALCLPFARFDIPNITLTREAAARRLWRISQWAAESVWPYKWAEPPWRDHSLDRVDRVQNDPPASSSWTVTFRSRRASHLDRDGARDVGSAHGADHAHTEYDHEAEERTLDRYLTERRELIAAQREQALEKDKSITALSSALLAASIAIVRFLVADEPIGAWSIYVAWTALGTAILSNTLSMHVASRSYDATLLDLHRQLDDPNYDPDSKELYPLTKWTRGLDVASTASFMIGVAAFTVFAIVNLVGR